MGGDVVSLTNPESRFMKNRGRFELSYNAQVTVDAAHEVIIANDVVQDLDDSGHLMPQIEQVMENLETDLTGVEVSADNGYYSIDNLLYLEGKKMDGYIPDDDLATEMKGKTRRGWFLSEVYVQLRQGHGPLPLPGRKQPYLQIRVF